MGCDGRTRLVVFACEVGGRWSEEVQDFVRSLVKAKARGEAPHLKVRASSDVQVGDFDGVQCSEGLRTVPARVSLKFGCGWRNTHVLWSLRVVAWTFFQQRARFVISGELNRQIWLHNPQ